MALPNDERDKLTTPLPSITINVSDLLNTDKLSEDTVRLFRSTFGFSEPTVAEEGEKLTDESEPQEDLTEHEEALRVLKLAEATIVGSIEPDSVKAGILVSIADAYRRLSDY